MPCWEGLLPTVICLNQSIPFIILQRTALLGGAPPHGLPYYEGVTLDQLCEYQKMKKKELLKTAAKLGDRRVVEFLTQPHKIIEYEFSKGDYNWAMVEAVEGGHKDIVQMMLDLGADDYKWAMRSAAGGGHDEIVQMLQNLII